MQRLPLGKRRAKLTRGVFESPGEIVHFSVVFLPDLFDRSAPRFLGQIALGLPAVARFFGRQPFGVSLLPDYIHFLARRQTMVLHVRMDVVYSCFGIFMIAAIVGAAIRLRRLFGPSWQDQL